jgi:sigma-B regulation protein RsbU (phosphoserine phosphatase)
MIPVGVVVGVSLAYITLLFLVAYYARYRQKEGRSIIANSWVYSLSIAVYATSWTFYGSVGKAATTGIDFLLIYLGPTLTAFSWWYLLRKIIRISKENNITSIADFISSRYGNSQLLGSLVTIICILGIIPYIALQLKAVSTTFNIICGNPVAPTALLPGGISVTLNSGFFAALILSIFGVIFGARHLASSERHEGLVAAIAVESVVKLAAFLSVGLFVTYGMFNGIGDIFSRMATQEDTLTRLVTIGEGGGPSSHINWFTTLYLSMGAIMLLPRQFHIMVLENSNEEHIKDAMWRFPIYMFLINLFVMPIALAGILFTGSTRGADYFVLTLPMQAGHHWLALVAFIGGFSAAAGMVMVESVAVSTMILNHILMPVVVRLKPRSWFPFLLINLKRLGIFVVVFLGYAYHLIVGETFMLVNMGLISFAAAAQFGPALIGSLYWRRGNRPGAVAGISLGFCIWLYTLLLPSFIQSGWWQTDLLENGPFGIALLKPTALFGMTQLDIWSHSLFWSMFLNLAAYLSCAILLKQDEREAAQIHRFVNVFATERGEGAWETKRLTKPVTIVEFVNLMSKFIGKAQAQTAITEFLGDSEIDERGGVSEFEMPNLKRFVEKTLAGSVGAAAAGAIVESFLSGQGSKMEPVYDILSTVRTSLDESREALYVRLKASEIMNRTTNLEIIMDDLLNLLLKEFKLDLGIISLVQPNSRRLEIRASRGSTRTPLSSPQWHPDLDTYLSEALVANRPQFLNDTFQITKPRFASFMEQEEVKSLAHIPIAREGELPFGILSVYSRSIVGLFNQPFLDLLASLAGQLAQAVRIDAEIAAREVERKEKEKAILENVRVARDMEIARQIQSSLLPTEPPQLENVQIAARCISATQVGGDYYDFFRRSDNEIDIVIADVSGHSVGSALIMAEARSVLRAQIDSINGASDILAALNRLLHDDLSGAELFITMFYVKYDRQTRLLTYANGGHNPPLIARVGSKGCTELDAEGLILGVKPQVAYEERTTHLGPGDVLLLYTDGIIEAQNAAGDFFGQERLCRLLSDRRQSEPEEIIDAVLSEVNLFIDGMKVEDDISMVVLRAD